MEEKKEGVKEEREGRKKKEKRRQLGERSTNKQNPFLSMLLVTGRNEGGIKPYARPVIT